MRKKYLILILLTLSSQSYCIGQNLRNVLFEYCNGTWNQWTPCGDVIYNDIISEYPQTIGICYHGAQNDPWQNFSGNEVRSLLGFIAYPSGIVDRTGIIYYRESWLNAIQSRYNSQPLSDVKISINYQNYNIIDRDLNVTLECIPLKNLSGQFKISFVVTEDSLIYPQTTNLICGGGSGGIINDYVHKNVARSMANGPSGEEINTGGVWNINDTVIKSISLNLDPSWDDHNCNLIAIIYNYSTTLYAANIEQAIKIPVTDSLIIAPSVKLDIKLLIEGYYYPVFNQMARKDTVSVFIRNSIAPFSVVDSAKSVIDSTTFRGLFKFLNTPTGIFYFTVKGYNSIETWSKDGGENLFANGTVYQYDFTNSQSKAYGNNQVLKDAKWCFYSGDVNQNGNINLNDIVLIYNDAAAFSTGLVVTDLNGDNVVNLTDLTIVKNNSSKFVSVRRP